MDKPQPTVSEEPSTPTNERRSPVLMAALLPLMFALGVGLGFLIWAPASPIALKPTITPTQAQVKVPAQTAVPTQAQAKRYTVPVDDDYIRGNVNAPVTIIEFSDFECPYCRKWFTDTWAQIQQTYGDKVRFIYRDFPLYGLHANAPMAAEAADCAGEQGAYYPYHDKLLMGSALGQDTYEKYATELKLNLTQFKDCLSSRKYKAEVEADYNWATNLGVQSTPTFFINGYALIGAQPFSVFKQLIDGELAAAGAK